MLSNGKFAVDFNVVSGQSSLPHLVDFLRGLHCHLRVSVLSLSLKLIFLFGKNIVNFINCNLEQHMWTRSGGLEGLGHRCARYPSERGVALTKRIFFSNFSYKRRSRRLIFFLRFRK